MNLEAFVLGTGGSIPLPNRHLSAVLLRRDGELFLFDCGEGTQVALRSLSLKWKKIHVILITHTHADHITGLAGMLMLSSQVDRDEPLHIVGPPRIREYVELNRAILEMYINYEIIVHELPPNNLDQIVWESDSYRIRSFPVKHSRICVGYVFEEYPRPGIFCPNRAQALEIPRGVLWSTLQKGNSITLDDGRIIKPQDVLGKQRKGRKISYVTDTRPIDRIHKEVKNSDFFICEGMFMREHLQAATEKQHMTAVEAARLAEKAGGIDQMGMTHFSPRYTNHQLKQLEQEAKLIFPNAYCLYDGMHITIPYKE